MISFVYPTFLWALAALAIPIIVHLFQFRRYKKVYFSNTGFLKELLEESNNAQKIKRLLILLARCLAIIFLVFAFAQPFIPTANDNKKGPIGVSIFVDNSFSMQSHASDQTLLDKGKALAIDIANTYDNDVRFQLITQDFSGKQQRLYNKEDFIEQVKNIQVSAGSHSLDEIHKRQVNALATENFDNKKIYIISDFQKNMGQCTNDSIHEMNLVQIAAAAQKNIYIDSAWLENPLCVVGQNNKLLVHIANESDETIEKLRVSMSLNKQQKAISTLSLDPHSSAIDTLHFNQNTSDWNQVQISIEDFPIQFDNNYFVSFYVYKAIQVQSIDGMGNNKYISALSNIASYFNTTSNSINQINYSNFPQQQLIIISNVKEISSGLQNELKKYIEQGGHIALFPAKEANISNINSFLSSIQAATFTKVNTSSKEVKTINTESSLLNDIFENTAQNNMSLPQSSYSFESNSNGAYQSEKIMTFADGQAFMTAYTVGQGKAYIFQVPLDASVCNFPMHALFLPILFKMAIDGNTFKEIQYTIGAKKSIFIPTYNNTISESSLKVQGQGIEFIPEQSLVNNQVIIDVRDQVSEAGIYQLNESNQKNALAYFAMNYNRQESKMQFYTNKDLSAQYAQQNTRFYEGNMGSIAHEVKENNRGIVLWKLCIIFALLFLLVEILLIRFWKTSSNN